MAGNGDYLFPDIDQYACQAGPALTKYINVSADPEKRTMIVRMRGARTASALLSTDRMMQSLDTAAVAVPVSVTNVLGEDNLYDVGFENVIPVSDCNFPSVSTNRLFTALKLLHEYQCTFMYHFTQDDLVVCTEHGVPELALILPPIQRSKVDIFCRKDEFFTPLANAIPGYLVKTSLETMLGLVKEACSKMGYSNFSETKMYKDAEATMTEENVISSPEIFQTKCENLIFARQQYAECLRRRLKRKRTFAAVVLEKDAKIARPDYGTSAGINLPGPTDTVELGPGEIHKYSSRIRCSVPEGHMLQITARSSATGRGLAVTGVVDRGYTGLIGITVTNVSSQSVIIEAGTSVAQMIFVKITNPEIEVVETPEDLYGGATARGENCNGSAGNSVAKKE